MSNWKKGGYGVRYPPRKKEQASWVDRGGAKPVDGRWYGNYSRHDVQVLGTTVCIIMWDRDKFIGCVQGNIGYFGKDAIRALENQAQYMLPALQDKQSLDERVASFSFGSVPHINNSDICITKTYEEFCNVVFNMILTNVYPFAVCDPIGIATQFNDEEAAKWREAQLTMFSDLDHLEYFRVLFGTTLQYLYANPFSGDTQQVVIACVQKLYDDGFLSSTSWNPKYRQVLTGWTHIAQYNKDYPVDRDTEAIEKYNTSMDRIVFNDHPQQDPNSEQRAPPFDYDYSAFQIPTEDNNNTVSIPNVMTYGEYVRGVESLHRAFLSRNQRAQFARRADSPDIEVRGARNNNNNNNNSTYETHVQQVPNNSQDDNDNDFFDGNTH